MQCDHRLNQIRLHAYIFVHYTICYLVLKHWGASAPQPYRFCRLCQVWQCCSAVNNSLFNNVLRTCSYMNDMVLSPTQGRDRVESARNSVSLA